ncbi:Uncharacterised protein [Chryseobacterium gleum]|jgi:hypothetical protein|uniref:Uncharacterized protein n=1 Tax=Chryseobacterium gleum TaxID=250 RepID=A0A3S4LXT3_CHRGE|nr:Uncharacterised protein [Chryseobacterium gleum]
MIPLILPALAEIGVDMNEFKCLTEKRVLLQ